MGKNEIRQTLYSTPPRRATLHDHINTDDFKEDRGKRRGRKGERQKKEGEMQGNGGQRKGNKNGSNGNRNEKDINGQS